MADFRGSVRSSVIPLIVNVWAAARARGVRLTVCWPSGHHVVEILVLNHASVDPPSAFRSGGVFGGCEGDERVVTSRDKAAELLFLIVGVKRRELDHVDEGVEAVVVAVDGDREAVAGPCLEPLLHVVGHVGGSAGDHRVVVDDAVGEHVAQGPAVPGHFEGAGGAWVVWAGYGVGELVRGQLFVELAGAEREADHGAEVADALVQVDDLVQEAAPFQGGLAGGGDGRHEAGEQLHLVRIASDTLGGVPQGLALGPGVRDGVRVGVDAAGVTARDSRP